MFKEPDRPLTEKGKINRKIHGYCHKAPSPQKIAPINPTFEKGFQRQSLCPEEWKVATEECKCGLKGK